MVPFMMLMRAVHIKVSYRQTLKSLADWLAIGIAISLPWSTSVTGILIVLWLINALLILDTAAVRRELATAAGGLPILLWALAAVGMLWSDATWSERFGGLGGFNRLLIIPLLLGQFRHSEHGGRVLLGFFASVFVVLVASWALALLPDLLWRGKMFGVPVKDYILQSEDFIICTFALLGVAVNKSRLGSWIVFGGLVALAVLFIANVALVVTGRTALLVVPVLGLLFGWRQSGWKGLLVAGALCCVIGVAVSLASPYLRSQFETSVTELQDYLESDAYNSTALHLDFLKKSVSFIETAPIIGHGTGSIPEQFRKAAVGEVGAASVASVNPHNQIFAVAIQLGLVGAVALVAMWVAHFMLFRGGGLTAWYGTIIVAENVVASLFNSHLFDFTQGWLYVFGVGVAGGMALREYDRAIAPKLCDVGHSAARPHAKSSRRA